MTILDDAADKQQKAQKCQPQWFGGAFKTSTTYSHSSWFRVPSLSEMALDDSGPAPDSKPGTPARRTARMQALSGLFRTPTRLTTPTMAVSRRNKRSRARASSLSSPSTPSTSPSANTPTLPAVVLQTYSLSTDSIVLTALPSVPFCCHEDLLTMSRTQLEAVVRALNERLPRRMRIGPEDDFWQNGDQSDRNEADDEDDGLSRMSEADMKKRIEELVGIRAIMGKNRVSRSGLGLGLGTRIRGVPPAPKAVRTRDPTWRPYQKTPWDMEADDDGNQTDDLSITIEDAFLGSSPLASRTKFSLHSRGRIHALSRLASLQEENEGSEPKEDNEDDETRPSKRQRVSPGSATQHSEGASQAAQEARESRLIENMDISGSPLMAGNAEALFDNVAGSDARAIPATTTQDGGTETVEKGVQTTLQRRRSARIKEIALKRASSVDGVKKTTLGAQLGLKSSILRSKTFSARRSSWNNSSSVGRSDTGKDLSTPRELVISLPFTSTPSQQKPESSSWSAPRVLRSHSQRLLNSSKSVKNNAPLGRSLSERYPLASDLAFVTIDRPRYRFTRRKSKGSKVAKGDDQELDPPKSATPVQVACQPQRGIRIYTNHVSGKHEHKKENDDPKVVTRYTGIGGLHALPSALCSFLTPRARAPSTSTAASTPYNGGDSPARTVDGECDTQAATTEPVIRDGTTVRVSEALERMVVDSLEDRLSEKESEE